MMWIRTCQSCGNKQEDKPQELNKAPTNAFRMRKCKRCASSDLDYGSEQENAQS